MPIRPTTTYPLDVNLSTGIGRIIGHVVRSGTVSVDVPHGGETTPEAASWLYVGGAGAVSVVQWNGNTQVYTGLLAGTLYPIASLMVNSTGTTATNLVWGS